MDSPADSTNSRASGAISRNRLGPLFLRHYPAYELVAWQPQGTLDDLMLDQIAEWLLVIEKVARPFERFVDFQSIDERCGSPRHLFQFARKRAEQFTGVAPVRTASSCDDWVGFGIACSYDSLMENRPIKARAFRDRAGAAEWLSVPLDVLTLKDEPAPHVGTTAPKHS
jgi:hypothetical protein